MSELESAALEDARRMAKGEVKADDFIIYGSPAPIIFGLNGLFVRKRSNPDKGGQYRIADKDGNQMGWIAFNHSKDERFNGVTDEVVLGIAQDHLRDLNEGDQCPEYEAAIISIEYAISQLLDRRKRLAKD